MKKILLNTLAVCAALAVLTTGCRKDTTLIVRSDSAVSGTVSFSKDLVPIFAKNCALSGCHADGGKSPTLTASKAYASLKGGNFVDTTKPANSIIYERLTGKLNPSMPLGGASNPSNINGLILAWIKQGAKNN